MTHAQLRIVSELFHQGRKSYEEMGILNEEKMNRCFKKSVDKAQDVAFKILRDAVKEDEGVE